jgi:hypothetical protein
MPTSHGGQLVKEKKLLEPTIGLEPMTCRLRKDPALRMLLLNIGGFGAFRGVLGHCGGGFVQQFVQHSWVSRLGCGLAVMQKQRWFKRCYLHRASSKGAFPRRLARTFHVAEESQTESRVGPQTNLGVTRPKYYPFKILA